MIYRVDKKNNLYYYDYVVVINKKLLYKGDCRGVISFLLFSSNTFIVLLFK